MYSFLSTTDMDQAPSTTKQGKRKASEFLNDIDDDVQAQIKLVNEETTIDKSGGIIPKYDIKESGNTYSIILPPERNDIFFDIQIFEYDTIKNKNVREIWACDGKRIKFLAASNSTEAQQIRGVVNKIARQMRANPNKTAKTYQPFNNNN